MNALALFVHVRDSENKIDGLLLNDKEFLNDRFLITPWTEKNGR